MTTIQNSSNPLAAVGSSVKTTTQTQQQMLNQDDFMKLMIAQMKSQDPTKPLDSQQYLGQLAQFSTLNSIQELQKSFDVLAQSLRSVQTTQATNLVGKQVLVNGSQGYYTPGGSIAGQITVPANVSNLTVKVYNTSGQLVNTADMGPQRSGQIAFNWDGNGATGAGIYRVEAQAIIDGKPQLLTTQVWNQVQSIAVGQNGSDSSLRLVGIGDVGMTAVQEIR